MAKLVGVYRSEDCLIERRQLPLAVDDKLKMIVQFNDTCVGCNQIAIKQRELERFVQKYQALTNDEVAIALMVTNKEIFSLLAQMVPCVGCRRSVERLFNQLVDSGHPALEPLVITKTSGMSIERNVLFDPKALYALFYFHGSKLNEVMESIPKSKKNKRCVLHSLDSHKTKSLGMWMDVWDVLSKECREEVVLIECDNLMSTLENYLRKHRFCSECKAKVLRAYNILVGDLDSASEKGYCHALYDGLSCCHEKRHLHVSSETDYIAKLIGRAEPELTGSRRERHAKTLDIAQEEVLTCLGIHLYERLHRIWQKLRAEEQTWQILFYLGVDALRKNFEMELERKQGISQLELTCLELLEEEQAKEQRREQKRQKRKKKKNKTKSDLECPDIEADMDKDKENCKCDENTNDTSATCASCDDHNLLTITKDKKGSLGCSPVVGAGHRGGGGNQLGSGDSPGEDTTAKLHCDSCECDAQRQDSKESVVGGRSDCGYSSGHEGCDSCSAPSSNEGSDVACSEGICNHEGDSPLCQRCELPELCRECINSTPCTRSSRHHSPTCSHKPCMGGSGARGSPVADDVIDDGTKYGKTLTLQDMLEAPCSSGEEEDFISEEEIQRFKANQTMLASQRQELRETLRQRFANMCMCRNPGECSMPNHVHCEVNAMTTTRGNHVMTPLKPNRAQTKDKGPRSAQFACKPK